MSPIEWAIVVVAVAFLIWVLDWWVLIAVGLLVILSVLTGWPVSIT